MMPATDYFAKPRTADYFDNLLTTNPGKLFRKYAVHPDDASRDYMVTTSDLAVQPMRKALQISQIEAGTVPSDKVVAYCHIEKKSRTASLMTRMEGADCLFMDVQNTPRQDWAPIYYLPWCPGKILNLTIPVRDTLLRRIIGPQPDIFFTAAINGCSIFIQGSAKNPTIFHAGGNPGTADRDSTKIWRQLVNFLKDPGKGQLNAEINKTHHVTEWHMDPSKPKSTQQALDYQQYLNTNYKTGTVSISSVSPWGCVFGLRDDQDDWNFYLQENATITVETITGTKTTVTPRTFGKDRVTVTNVVQTQTYGRPMVVRKIWPSGGGSIKMLAPLPVVLNWSKV